MVDGEIRDRKSGRSVTFGEVATAASQLRAPRRVTLTPPEQWRFIGKTGTRVDAPDKVRGAARYGMDVSLPDMRTAVGVHCPHPQGSLASYSAAPSLAVDGVEDVFAIQGAIAIVAKNYWSARQAASKLEVAWDAGESKGVDSAATTERAGEFFHYAIEHPVSLPRKESAMVPIVDETIEGERISIYNPSGGSVHPLNGLRFTNTTEIDLMGGPLTVFESGTYAGDSQIGPVYAGDERIISFSMDKQEWCFHFIGMHEW